MTFTPSVSVIIPVYNCEKTIAASIASVLNQSYRDFEVICVDNNSSDNSRRIIENIAKNDNRIKIFDCKTKGIVPALNTGLLNTSNSTKYIARQDGDDIWFENKLEKQIKYLEENKDIDILGTNILIHDVNKGQKKEFIYPTTHNECMKWYQNRQNPICHVSVVFRKRIIEKAGIYDDRFHFAEDMSYWLKASRWYKLANLNEILLETTFIPKDSYDSNVNHALLHVEETYRKVDNILKNQKNKNPRNILFDNKNILLLGPAPYIQQKKWDFSKYDLVCKINRMTYMNLGDGDRCDVLFCNIDTSSDFGESPYDYNNLPVDHIRIPYPEVMPGFKENLYKFANSSVKKPASLIEKEVYLELFEMCNKTSPNTGSLAIYDILKSNFKSLHIGGLTMFLGGYDKNYRKMKIGLEEAKNINKKSRNHNIFYQASAIYPLISNNEKITLDKEVIEGYELAIKSGAEWKK